MDDKLLLAAVAAGSAVFGGFITAVLGPVIRHRLEQSTAKKAHQRVQIQKWREMVLQVDRKCDGDINVGPTLQVHPEFLSLEPYLNEETRRSVNGQNHTIVVGQSLAKPLQDLKREIARIEKEWGLR